MNVVSTASGTLSGSVDAVAAFKGVPRDAAMSNALMEMWVQFARTGDPNGPGLPAWPACTASGDDYLTLAEGFPTASGWRRRDLDFLRAFFRHG